MLVPTRVWARGREFFQMAGIGTYTIVSCLLPSLIQMSFSILEIDWLVSLVKRSRRKSTLQDVMGLKENTKMIKVRYLKVDSQFL